MPFATHARPEPPRRGGGYNKGSSVVEVHVRVSGESQRVLRPLWGTMRIGDHRFDGELDDLGPAGRQRPSGRTSRGTGHDVYPSEDLFPRDEPSRRLTLLTCSGCSRHQSGGGGRHRLSSTARMSGPASASHHSCRAGVLDQRPSVRAAVAGAASPMRRTWSTKAFQSNHDQAESGSPL